MIKLIKKLTLSTIALIAVMAPVAVVSVPVFAQTQQGSEADIQASLCAGASLTVDGTCEADGAPDRVNDLVATVINIFSWVVGVVAVIMIIVGGFQYITSGGDSGKVTNAKNTILFAIVGLVIVALAQIIVNFVLSRAIDA